MFLTNIRTSFLYVKVNDRHFEMDPPLSSRTSQAY